MNSRHRKLFLSWWISLRLSIISLRIKLLLFSFDPSCLGQERRSFLYRLCCFNCRLKKFETEDVNRSFQSHSIWNFCADNSTADSFNLLKIQDTLTRTYQENIVAKPNLYLFLLYFTSATDIPESDCHDSVAEKNEKQMLSFKSSDQI